MTVTKTYLCLGSNVGDRRAAIVGGVAELERSGVTVEAQSSLYETEPVGLEDQRWFLNRVVCGTTKMAPDRLLAACKRIERWFGRRRSRVRFGPRTLDIDILLYGDHAISTDRLTIPHPRIRERRFVLVPLVEIAPGVVDPRDGTPYAEILERLDEGKKVSKSLPSAS